MEAQRRDDGPELAGLDGGLALVRRRLLQQAFVFEDPAAYAAGVEDALAAVQELQRRRELAQAAPEVEALGDGPILLRGATG